MIFAIFFHNVKIFLFAFFYVSKSLASISRLFHVRIVLSLSSTLNFLENLVIAPCFPDCSAYLVKCLQLKLYESVQFANITITLPHENSLLYSKSHNSGSRGNNPYCWLKAKMCKCGQATIESPFPIIFDANSIVFF